MKSSFTHVIQKKTFLCITLDSKGRQGVCAGVCERVHQLHHFRSEREMPSGETQDDKRRRHPVRHVHAGLRYVCGASEALPAEVQRGDIDILMASLYIIEVKSLIYLPGIKRNTLYSGQRCVFSFLFIG